MGACVMAGEGESRMGREFQVAEGWGGTGSHCPWGGGSPAARATSVQGHRATVARSVCLAGADPAWLRNVRTVLVPEEKGARGFVVRGPTRWPFTVSLSSQVLSQAQAVTPHPQGEEGNHRDFYAAPGGQCLGPYLPRGGGSRSRF